MVLFSNILIKQNQLFEIDADFMIFRFFQQMAITSARRTLSYLFIVTFEHPSHPMFAAILKFHTTFQMSLIIHNASYLQKRGC